MPPKPFYEINPDRYLFRKSEEKPEEKVRQWVLFELLSTYGVHINNIKIECPVKVGTRTHYADIVIHKDDAPYVVIECKKLKYNKINAGVGQALSYADANSIKAKVAVFTNGDAWLVKQKMRNEWVDIPDIGRAVDSDSQIAADELVANIHELEPILYWFDEIISKKDAQAYFCALQIIFHSRTFPLDQIDENLCIGTDNLLRVISAKGAHQNYITEKMLAACQYYSKFLKERLLTEDDLFELNKDDFFYISTNFCLEFERLVQNSKGVINSEVLMCRFVVTLFKYFRKISRRKPAIQEYIDIPIGLNDELHKLLDFQFKIRLGIGYPDRLDNTSHYPFRISCENAWNEARKDSKF